MSFREWLLNQLINDGVVDEYTSEDEINRDMLLSETDLEEADLNNYEAQFKEHCESLNVDPDWDLDEE